MSALVRRKIGLLVMLLAWSSAGHSFAQSAPSAFDKVRQDSERTIRNKLSPVISRYCHQACEIVNILVEVDEQVTEVSDLGFEAVMGEGVGTNVYVSKATIEIQIDDRVTTVNRERMRSILLNNLAELADSTDIVWRPVTIPQIGANMAVEEELKRQIKDKVARAIDLVIEKYCPEACVLSAVQVEGKLVTNDEALNYDDRQLVRDQANLGILRIDAIDAEVTMDQKLSEGRRQQITSIMQAKTRFAEPVILDIQAVAFPQSFAKLKAQEDSSSQDPYGLEKLRRMLVMFRDLAGTKEIINSTTTSASEKASVRDATTESSQTGGAWEPLDYLLVGLGVVGLVIIAILLNRILGPGPSYKAMRHAAEENRATGGASVVTHTLDRGGAGRGSEDARREISLKLKCDDLRQELTRTFMDMPRVAKETFARLLQEDGIEETAKYVHIFGHLVVFELLDDPQLQRELYELSEFYHNSEVEIGQADEYKLLQKLKNKVTANEIKVMTRRQLDQFDFLSKLDAAQIYNLIAEEKPQMQSIVLTQLDHKRRRAVFDMYDGAPKVTLMHELCRADAIPKDYLANVAKALHKKVLARPEFDTENLRSSDILLDLLEKSTLDEQRSLMKNLVQTNADAARGIKLKLVTVEMMPYLKDGHLLEIMLGLERQDLMTFFAGTREHIRGLVLSKAPQELAESWVEDLNAMAGYDEQAYRLTEMKILGRIRSLASNGAISLLDINDMIFSAQENVRGDEGQELPLGADRDGSMVA